jgi:acetoacetyl-CoA synthetase
VKPVEQPLWRPTPEQAAATNQARFAIRAAQVAGAALPDHAALHAWSIASPEEFWSLLWDEADVRASARGATVIDDCDAMPGARFFPDARLNFAENLLRRRGPDDALVFRGEDQVSERLSWDDLRERVAGLAGYLRDAGVEPGDIVAGVLPNMPAAIIGMLATASLGAVWTTCSPDFGVGAILDRFGQTRPKVLLGADGYFYKGRLIDSLARLRDVVAGLPSVQRIVVAQYAQPGVGVADVPGAEDLDEAIARFASTPLTFTQVRFNDPLYVLYSSGTTGPPKCIVHGVGGTLLKHLSEHQLMCDIRPGDRVFYFTTCGWMMWNWLASALASEATLLLYDGNPAYPEATSLFEFAATERCTLFGTSAKFIDALANVGARPGANYDLRTVRTITSTGSPLSPESFDYVYAAISDTACLSSIAGGTDIVGCFVGGDPTGPVWRGEIQARVLGMAVEIFDDDGGALHGVKGELVCTRPFPSMPVGFWGDVDGSQYRAAYFERYPGVWHQGDYAELTAHGGIIIHGRSDATLNPGGVRIGTAEIYRVVENIEGVAEAVVVGQDWEDDVRVVLFIVLNPGWELNAELESAIRTRIREDCSPRHVPARILRVSDIPRTKSGKIVELAVRDAIHGLDTTNAAALANPDALAQYRDRPELLR